MKFLLAVEVPDAVLEAEWQDAVEARETTQTLEEYRGEQPESARDYLSGWFTAATFTIADRGAE